MKEFKTILECDDAMLTQMSKDGWSIVHLQFDGVVLRGVFARTIAKPIPKPLTMVSEAVVPVEVVAVGTNPNLYRRPPMNPPYPQNLKPVIEERIAELDAEIWDGMRDYWAGEYQKPYVSRPLQLLEVCK